MTINFFLRADNNSTQFFLSSKVLLSNFLCTVALVFHVSVKDRVIFNLMFVHYCLYPRVAKSFTLSIGKHKYLFMTWALSSKFVESKASNPLPHLEPVRLHLYGLKDWMVAQITDVNCKWKILHLFYVIRIWQIFIVRFSNFVWLNIKKILRVKIIIESYSTIC